jgi:rRNA maturation protein Rpf1
MVVCHFPYGPTAYFSLHNVVLRHDIKDQGTVSEAFPHLIFDNFNSKLGNRVSSTNQDTEIGFAHSLLLSFLDNQHFEISIPSTKG